MTGKVAERFVQPGEKVSPDTRIVSIVDLSRMEIEALVPSSDIGSVRAGQSVALNIEGIEGAREGKILRIAPSTAQGTRSVPVYIGLENRDSRVPAGLFVQGTLTIARRDAAIVVPEAAIREAGGRSFVYLVDARPPGRTPGHASACATRRRAPPTAAPARPRSPRASPSASGSSR